MTSNLTHDVDHCDTRLKTYIPNYSLFQIWHTRTTTARPAAYMRLIRLSMCLYGTPSFPYPNITVVSSPNKYNKFRRSFQTFLPQRRHNFDSSLTLCQCFLLSNKWRGHDVRPTIPKVRAFQGLPECPRNIVSELTARTKKGPRITMDGDDRW